MDEILDSLKSEMTLDGLVGPVVLSDGADDTRALVESERQRHTVPAEEQQQSMPSISNVRTCIRVFCSCAARYLYCIIPQQLFTPAYVNR